MKKINLFLIILIISSKLLSIEVDNIFQKDNFYYQMNSFMGTDYFPGREYKSTNYFDRHAFYAGWNYYIHKNTDFWFDLTFNDKFYEKEILLNKTGITYHKNNFSFSYKIDRLKYGAKSKIYNLQVRDRFYDFGVIENYRYNGVEVLYSKENIQFLTTLAANDFNSVIGNLAVGYSNDNFNTQFYYLLVGRNEEYNVRNHSFGIETSLNFSNISIYQSSVYQYLPTYSKGDKIKSLLEISYSPAQLFAFGTNMFTEIFNDGDIFNWQSQTYCNFNFENFENYLFFRINRSDEFTTDYTNREYSYLCLYKFTNSLLMGINYSYFIPDFDINYHQFGFQIEFNYEKNI